MSDGPYELMHAALCSDMSDDVETVLIGILHRRLRQKTNEERLEFIAKVMAPFCKECGSLHIPCYCWRDE